MKLHTHKVIVPVIGLVWISAQFWTAQALTINVNAGAANIGQIVVNSGGGGVSGDFTSTVGGPPVTLQAAATQAGGDHFDWYQIVSGTHPLIPGGGPQVDPLPGGQGGQWADNLPWYWDETQPAAGTPGYDASYQLSANTFATRLHFEDYPGGPVGTSITFNTWLVCLNANGSFNCWEGGFSWTWANNAAGGVVVGAPAALGAGVVPTAAQYTALIGGFATSIPEPTSVALLGMGLLVLVCVRRVANNA